MQRTLPCVKMETNMPTNEMDDVLVDLYMKIKAQTILEVLQG